MCQGTCSMWFLSSERSLEIFGPSIQSFWKCFRGVLKGCLLCSCVLPIVSVAQLCPTHCDSTDRNLPGLSDHRILQARILEWVAISSSRGSSPPRDRIHISCIAGRFFTVWASRDSLGRLSCVLCSCRCMFFIYP